MHIIEQRHNVGIGKSHDAASWAQASGLEKVCHLWMAFRVCSANKISVLSDVSLGGSDRQCGLVVRALPCNCLDYTWPHLGLSHSLNFVFPEASPQQSCLPALRNGAFWVMWFLCLHGKGWHDLAFSCMGEVSVVLSFTDTMPGVEEEYSCASWMVLPDLLVHSGCETCWTLLAHLKQFHSVLSQSPLVLLSPHFQSHHVPVGCTVCTNVSRHLSEQHIPASKIQLHSCTANSWFCGRASLTVGPPEHWDVSSKPIKVFGLCINIVAKTRAGWISPGS